LILSKFSESIFFAVFLLAAFVSSVFVVLVVVRILLLRSVVIVLVSHVLHLLPYVLFSTSVLPLVMHLQS